MSISVTTAVLSADLTEVFPMDPCENAGRPDEVPVVFGNADEDDEADEEEDLDEDEDQEDEDDEDLDEDVDDEEDVEGDEEDE